MCGIAGVLRTDGQPVAAATVGKMSAAIAHRGPDGDGVWTNTVVGLGHRRLAIIDLSPAAHQPMSNVTGDVVITYNGELFNFQKLRLELEALGRQFRSRSDTEVVLYAYEEWGEACVDRFNGMFAFAIWDARKRELFLARDRFGVKPLYYLYDGAKLLFGSEIKAILAYPGVRRGVCYEALTEYFSFQNLLGDHTLFDGVKLLPPGCRLTIGLEGSEPRVERYWDYCFRDPLDVTEDEAEEEIYRLFNQAVVRQLVSDVPIACYLSGGIDSGSVTAVARQHLGRLMTFTMGFDLSSASGLELGFDERAQSEALSNVIKTEHYEMVLHAGDMEHVMPELVRHLEDLRIGQCYPNYYVARLASKFVKVVLSGAGGDELFGGYPWRYYRGLAGGGDGYFRSYYDFWQRLVADDDKSHLFNARTYARLKDHSTFDAFKSVILKAGLPLETNADLVNASLYFELKTFLHGILVVEDKVSMAHGLETRVPFLDNDLVSFATRLPPRFKIRNVDRIDHVVDEDEAGKLRRYELKSQDGKIVMRRAMSRIISGDTLGRVKQGFSAPDASWFRGESIDYVNTVLRDSRAHLYEYLEPAFVQQKLDDHVSGRVNNRLLIWSLLSFEWWLQTFMD